MAWAAIGAAAVTTIGGAMLSDDSGGGGGGGGSATGMADPFAGQRPQYQTKLQELMNGTFKPTDPSYQWRFDQGMEAVNRSKASGGLLNSGNWLAALTDYGQGLASTEYGNEYQRLAQLAGANIGSPATAGQIQYGQDQQNQQAMTAGLGALGNAAGGVFSSWMNNSSSPVNMTGFQSNYTPTYSWSGGGTPAYQDPLPVSSASFGAGWMV